MIDTQVVTRSVAALYLMSAGARLSSYPVGLAALADTVVTDKNVGTSSQIESSKKRGRGREKRR